MIIGRRAKGLVKRKEWFCRHNEAGAKELTICIVRFSQCIASQVVILFPTFRNGAGLYFPKTFLAVDFGAEHKFTPRGMCC